MNFMNGAPAGLMATTPGELQVAAEQANLCMEERISKARQATYEKRMGAPQAPQAWSDWRKNHYRYVQNEVRRRDTLSAAFTDGEPSLRPRIEPNQYLCRVERIDGLLDRYPPATGAPVGVEQINGWISARDSAPSGERTVDGLQDLDRLVPGDSPSPEVAALHELTELFNDERGDGRPSFVVFEAEFPRLKERSDWAKHLCERCGLAHFFTDGPVTLACSLPGTRGPGRSLRCREEDERSRVRRTHRARPADVRRLFHGAEGHALGTRGRFATGTGLPPSCRRADPRQDGLSAGPLVAVDTLERSMLSAGDVARLRKTHLDCIRRSPGNAGYGRNC